MKKNLFEIFMSGHSKWCESILSVVIFVFDWLVEAKTLNDKKSEWPKSRNSKLLKMKCRKAINTNDFEVLNKNLRTQRCRKKFKSKANIRMVKITKGEITN